MLLPAIMIIMLVAIFEDVIFLTFRQVANLGFCIISAKHLIHMKLLYIDTVDMPERCIFTNFSAFIINFSEKNTFLQNNS